MDMKMGKEIARCGISKAISVFHGGKKGQDVFIEVILALFLTICCT
jgi:hypothetical protein